MGRQPKITKEISEKQPKKQNKSIKPKIQTNTFNTNKTYTFEDPHLDRFFQQNKQKNQTTATSFVSNRNVIVIQDDEDDFNDDDRMESVTSECTNDYFNLNEEYDDSISTTKSSFSTINSRPKSDRVKTITATTPTTRMPTSPTVNESDSIDSYQSYKFDCDIKFNENDTYRVGSI